MNKQHRLNTLRSSIKEHEEKLAGLDRWIETLVGYQHIDYYLLKLRAEEGISLRVLIEGLVNDAKSLQEEIDLEARTESL